MAKVTKKTTTKRAPAKKAVKKVVKKVVKKAVKKVAKKCACGCQSVPADHAHPRPASARAVHVERRSLPRRPPPRNHAARSE